MMIGGRRRVELARMRRREGVVWVRLVVVIMVMVTMVDC